MTFGIFEASVSSDEEVGIARQAAQDKLSAAIYDVREAFGPFFFQAHSLEDFRDRVAMTKNDQSLFKVIEAHLPPVTGTVRRICGKNGELEKEFKAILATGITAADDDDDDSDSDDGFGGKKAPPFGSKDAGAHSVPGSEEADANWKQDWDAAGIDSQGYSEKDNHNYGNDYHSQHGTAFDPQGVLTRLDNGMPKLRPAYGGGDPTVMLQRGPTSEDWLKGSSRRQADFEGDMDLDSTFKSSDSELIPKDNFEGYKDSVDQGADSKVDRNFTSSAEFVLYSDWCMANQVSPKRIASLDEYSTNLSDSQYMRLARAIQAWDFEHKPKAPKGQSNKKLKDVTAGQHDALGEGGDGYPYYEPPPELPPTAPQQGKHRPENAGVTSLQGGPGSYPVTAGRDPMHRYIAWCKKNGYKRLSARNVQIYSRGNPELTVHLARRMKAAIHTARLRQAGENPFEGNDEFNEMTKGIARNSPGLNPNHPQHQRDRELAEAWGRDDHWPPREGQRRQAAPDYLQKADDALTQLLNQKAEEFQETIAPMQQALVTVQQAIQLQQQANPLNVMPPAGSVSVMPGQAPPGQVGMPDPSGGQDPNAAAAAALAPAQAAGQLPGGDPSGGAPPDGGQGAPPPAAGGEPPPDPSQMMARKRGGQGKGHGASKPRQAGVTDLWNHYQQQLGQSGNLGIGGDADYQDFASRYKVGPQALNKLKTQHGVQAMPSAPVGGMGVQMANRRQADVKQVNHVEEAVKGQWRQMDAQMSGLGYKFDKGGNVWTKPGHAPIKNHWQHTGGQHEYNPHMEEVYDNPGFHDPEMYHSDPELDPTTGPHGGFPDEQNVMRKELGPPGGPRHQAGNGDDPDPYGVGNSHQFRNHDPNQIFYPQRGYEGWGHESGPSGPPYVRDQPSEDYEGNPLPPHRHEASQKQAWMGWGPAVAPRTRHVANWDWDNHLNGYVANSPHMFTCHCGSQIPTPTGFQRCACGSQWNSYVIGTGGNTHEASVDKFLVREIPARRDVIVANHHGQRMESVDTHGMDPQGHAYHQDSFRNEKGPGRDYDPNTGWQPNDHDELQAELAGEDDDSGYNWGPEPRRARRTEANPFSKVPYDPSQHVWSPASEGGGWTHTTGGEIRPSQDAPGKWQLYGPTVTMSGQDGKLAPMKQPTEDHQSLMDWWNHSEGGPAPAGQKWYHFGSPNILDTYADAPLPPDYEKRNRHSDDVISYEHQLWGDGHSDPSPGRHRREDLPGRHLALVDPRTGAIHNLIDPGQLGEGEDPDHPKARKMTDDWHHRDINQRWTS